MTGHPPPQHFAGRTVPEHLKEARARGALAAAEIHGTEIPGHYSAGADAAKDMAFALLFLWVVLSQFMAFQTSFLFMVLFASGWTVWKTARSALLGWSRMERMHRVIEEERWEIEHHRPQERQELTEMYRAKGLTGKLLEEVVDVLMADDNRLLRLMLEEELGLTLEIYDHPLKQAFGAFCGSVIAAALCLFAYWAYPPCALPIASAVVIAISTYVTSRLGRNRALSNIVWNLAVAGAAAGSIYFLSALIGSPR